MLIRDTLQLWRDAERALTHVPTASRDRQVVLTVVLEMRETYARLTGDDEWSRDDIELGREKLAAARAILEELTAAQA